MISFDGAVSNVNLCGHILAQKLGVWKISGEY